jgi:mono/diheme cytochrome c family protein
MTYRLLKHGAWAVPVLCLALCLERDARSQTKPAPPKLPADHAAQMAKGLDIFKKHVKPILVDKCIRCHGGRETIEAELDLTDRDTLLKGGQSGPAIVPGKAKESLLVKLISHAREPHMPRKASKLPDAAIAHIANWIDLGAPYNAPLDASKRKAPSWTERVVAEDARSFWSFQPLKRVAPPAANDRSWGRTLVDRFILEKLESAGVKPNPMADKQQLIRRAYFDVIGLPPPPEEVRRFLDDKGADAYDKMLDRLLASPHYGERWARHWLDLARFAESHGFEHDTDRPSAYHYRDFVIEALNGDLPYNTFVKWQIAGDEYEPENPLALKATGFLAAGVHSTQITKNEVEKHRYDEMDDKLATLGTAMLGLTIGCARCHDHKYDPIPQRDYYRMLSTFTTTVRSEVMTFIEPPDYRAQKEAYDRERAPYLAAFKKREQEVIPMLDELVKDKEFVWEYVDIKDAKSKEGATLTVVRDIDRVHASGTNPKFDIYTISAQTGMREITSIALTVFPDHNAHAGPGRAADGNFALSDFSITIAPIKGTAKPRKIQLRNPRATVEQKGFPIKAAIDNDPKSAWAIGSQVGLDEIHSAAFETDGAIGFEGGSLLTFTLKFNSNEGHNLGRFAFAVSNAPKPPALTAGAISPGIGEILRIPAKRRSEAQTKRLLDWALNWAQLDPEWNRLKAGEFTRVRPEPQLIWVKALVATEGLPAVRLHTQGEDFLPVTHFLKRGDVDQKESLAEQGFLQVLMPDADSGKRWQISPPKGWRTSYRRRALAEWITDADNGAGALLARVIVNRLWQHHIGRGLVATPSDFGARGEPPTHPELLDWLAAELIKGGWKLKPIHKLIMTSAVYMQTTQFDEARAKVDRDNKLCWRHPPRRLEAEVIRDSLLAVSGALDPKMYGPGTLDDNSRRRSIYFTVKRSKLVPMMTIFDAPDALGGIGERPTTTIAPQALHLMNSPQVRSWAKSFAKRIAPDEKTPLEGAVKAGYLIALSRTPQRDELADGLAFVRQQMESYPMAADCRDRALADFCQVLMCLNEFVYVE